MEGKEIRLARLFKHARLFVVPMDHGITAGPVAGLEDIHRAAAEAAAGGADAVLVHKGMARRIAKVIASSGCELIVHLSASTVLAPDPDQKELVSSVESAIRLGATAVSAHVNLASANEAGMLKDLGGLAEECDRWGMPLLAMMYVRDKKRAGGYDPGKISHAARIAEELGADIVKVNYTGTPESFAGVVGAVKIPVIVAGGPKMDSADAVLAMVGDAARAGAKGVAIGRNVFQDGDPRLMAARIRAALDEMGETPG
jgi:predicted phospho-2-dehydro-3-deoxyheptonate aldolase